MSVRGKVIVLARRGDVPSFTVHRDLLDTVHLGVNDADSDDSSDGAPLITAKLDACEAIALARELLLAANVDVGRANICGWNTAS